MRALSVKYPWSALIAWGLKPFEIRTWRTNMRGEVLICSSASPARSDNARRVDIDCGPIVGVAIALVELVDCRPFVEADAKDAWCRPRTDGKPEFVWELRRPREVERVPVLGRLNFFDVERSIVQLKSYPCPAVRMR